MTPDALLECFDDAAAAAVKAVRAIAANAIRDRTSKPGQYALDIVADDAACAVLAKANVRIVSEESGVHGPADAAITVVIDPIDGSTNCSRGIPYWCTSLCALDGDGALVALVQNHPAQQRNIATRGGGAFRDGVQLHASSKTAVNESVIGFSGWPARPVVPKQTRVLGSIALELCDVAAGGLDAHVDGGSWSAPWDYLGGALVCLEAGATVRDFDGAAVFTDDPDARRQILAAGTAELADAIEATQR
jgi:fructose-1,6-bisphosphatase/inositol monophosphatase family enzyme